MRRALTGEQRAYSELVKRHKRGIERLIRPIARTATNVKSGGTYLLHDVINWNMIDGFYHLLTQHGLSGKIFTRTASGMALAYRSVSPDFAAYLDCFTEPAETFRELRQLYTGYADPIATFHTGYRS